MINIFDRKSETSHYSLLVAKGFIVTPNVANFRTVQLLARILFMLTFMSDDNLLNY